MTSKHRTFLIFTVLLAVSGLAELLFGPIEEYLFRLSPISLWQLPAKAWFAIAATITASILAWIVAVIVGGAVGFVAAAGWVARRERGRLWSAWASTAAGCRRAFTWLYVIPLVLTLQVVTTILLKGELDGHLSQPVVGFLLVITSGIALAGQRVFVAIDDAVATAGSDDVLLASSLYLGRSGDAGRVLSRMRRVLREARFLVACRIRLLAQALEQAFHLAVVGVVILETVSGLRVYEKLFPQEAGLLSWGGGIGRIIIDGQNATNPALVAGAVWLILIIDSLIAWGIREAAFHHWVTPYRRDQ